MLWKHGKTFLDDLSNDEWADNIAVQALSDI